MSLVPGCGPAGLLDLATGFQRAQVLFALIALEVPARLAAGPREGGALARELGLHPLAADRFLNACVALGLLARGPGGYANAPETARFLVRGGAEDVGEFFLRYARGSWRAWSDLPRRLREWRPGATEEEPADPLDQGVEGLRAQQGYTRLLAEALAGSWDFAAHARLLDLGGGLGTTAITLCRRFPQLEALLVELPEIAAAARAEVRGAGLASRIAVRAGDFARDPLPGGCDVALLANLLSVASEETNRALLRRLFEALPPGGAVLLSGWILDDARTSPLLPVLFCLEDISWRAPDVERSASTYAAWLAEAGFTAIERRMYCPPTSLIAARRP